MRQSGRLIAKDTGKNWYVEKTLTLSGTVYEILDAEWMGLEQHWILTVRRAK
jgi:hypothetical protein